MKHPLATFALLLPLAACMPGYGGLPGGGGPGPHGDGSADSRWSDSPLRARLTSTAGGLTVSLSDAAYVAVFRVVPGWGADLVYPRYGSERARYGAGYSRLSITPSGYGYGADGYGYRGGYGYGSGYGRQEYLLLVASREPLYLSRVQRGPYALQEQLGYGSFATIDTRRMMSDLVSLVLPPVPDRDWTSDVLTLYSGQRGYPAYGYEDHNRYITVQCQDGRVLTVPSYAYRNACYRGQRGAAPPPVRPKDPRSGGHGDTTDVDVPTRRRPGEVGRPGTAGQPLKPRINPMVREPIRRPDGDTGARPRAEEPRVYARPPEPRREQPARREAPRAEPRVERQPPPKRRAEPAPPPREQPSEPRAAPPPARRP